MSIRGDQCGLQETGTFAAGFGASAGLDRSLGLSLGSSQLLIGELLLLIGP